MMQTMGKEFIRKTVEIDKELEEIAQEKANEQLLNRIKYESQVMGKIFDAILLPVGKESKC